MTNLIDTMAKALYEHERNPDGPSFYDLDPVDSDWFYWIAQAALDAIEASETHRIVPVDPTEAMTRRGLNIAEPCLFAEGVRELYAAMLDAAPKVTE